MSRLLLSLVVGAIFALAFFWPAAPDWSEQRSHRGIPERGAIDEHFTPEPDPPSPGPGGRPVRTALNSGAEDQTSQELRVFGPGSRRISRAAVTYLSEAGFTLATAKLTHSPNPLEIVERHGRQIPYENGVVRLPPSWEGGYIVGRSGTLIGLMRLSPSSVFMGLRLYRDAGISVRVVDTRGRTVPGVPVELRTSQTDCDHTLWRGVTGSNGLVRVVGDVLGHVLTTQQFQLFEVRLAVPVKNGPAVTIRAQNLPKSPIQLTLPPMGQLEVRLTNLHPDVVEPITVSLHDEQLEASLDRHGTTHQLVERGSTRFQWVGLGLKLRVDAFVGELGSQGGVFHERSHPVVQGPKHSGECVVVSLDMSGRSSIITGTIVGTDGQPMSDLEFDLTLLAEGGQSKRALERRISTNGQGVFRVPINDGLPASATRSLEFRIFQSSWDSAGRRRAARCERRARCTVKAVRPGLNNAGALVFRSRQPLCHGVVVSLHEVPIPGALVEVARRQETGGWSWPETSTITGGDGSFTIHDRIEPGELSISVAHPDYQRIRHRPFDRSGAALRLKLADGGKVVGKLAMPEGVKDTDLTVHLVGPARTPVSAQVIDGTFEFCSLPPGPAQISVATFGSVTPCRVLDNVIVKAGATAKDPRLNEVEIPNLRCVEFAVVDARGVPIPGAWIVFAAESGQNRMFGEQLPNGKSRVVTAEDPLQLTVWAAGYRAREVASVRDGQAVRLQRSPELRVAMPKGVKVPAAPYSLGVVLTPVEHRAIKRFEYRRGLRETGSSFQLPWQVTRASCTPAGHATLRPPRSGRYRIQWTLKRGNAEFPVGLAPAGGKRVSAHTVTLPSTGVPQQIVGVFTSQQVEAARRELNRLMAARPR